VRAFAQNPADILGVMARTPVGRPFRLFGIAGAAVVVAAGLWWQFLAPSQQPGPIVLISIDTLRADRLPLYGYAAGRTPALDTFARDAVLFTRAYAHAPQTLPSHASMFTGRLPFEHAVRDNLGFSLSEEATTLPELLRTAGYRTGGFVSSFVLREETGIGQGFDHFDAQFPASASDRSPGQVQRPGPETLQATTAWLDNLGDSRALLFFHIYEPHKPYAPPASVGAFEDPYDGEVAFADHIVGRLLDSLRQRGWYDEATIVITADHGEGLGDHGEQEHGLFLYEEVMRVPLLIKAAGNRNAGARRDEPVQHIDLLPTLMSAAGLSAPAGLRGRDLTPLIAGTGTITPQGIYAEAMYARYHFGWSELRSLTDDRYKFIEAPREELYDLERDPGERTNLAGDRAQATAAMRAALASLSDNRPPAAPAMVSDADRQRLAALGYVGTGAPVSTSSTDLPDPKDKAHILRQYRDATDALSAMRFEDGARGLAAILAEDPNMTDVWSQYATTLVRLGRLEEAYRAWREVVQRKPDEPSGLLGAASVLVALGRLADARTYAELAVAQAPAAAHQALANIALTEGNDAEARRQADLAEQADPTLPMRAMIDGLLRYNAGDFAGAVPLLDAARQRFAQRPIQASDLHYFLGDALARLERYGEAEPMLREEIRLYPQNIRARAGLAMLQAATGRMAEADRTVEQMMRVAPAAATFSTAADLYGMFGMPAKAAAARARASR
jgi:arylsulfatase A-like enzyme/Flp pilus assembly protein TadD